MDNSHRTKTEQGGTNSGHHSMARARASKAGHHSEPAIDKKRFPSS